MTFDEMASEILKARQSATPTQMAAPEKALSRDDAMVVQTKVFEQLGSELIGWKVGATNEGAQAAFGIDSPFYGPMPASAVMENGASIEKSACVGACEPEYAFKLARDFPQAGEDITAENAAAAVESLHIAIEVIGRAMGHADFANGIGVTMDFGGNVAFVVGPEVENWNDQDLASAAVESRVDDELIHTGNGEPVMGSPINSLVWLANTLAAKGGCIKAGEWVSTGTCTPAVPASAGSTYSAKFSSFGEVCVKFT